MEIVLIGLVGCITGVLFVFVVNFGVLRREMRERHTEVLSVLEEIRDRIHHADAEASPPT